jgi:sugar O-acyltransferase (sialic acid O-acetyltransferase NeuD family)
MENPVIILGATKLGRVALDIFASKGIIAYCFLDDNEALHNTEVNDVLVLGATRDDGYLKLIGNKCESFIAVEDQDDRKSLADMLKTRRKVMPVNAIHDRAYLAESVFLGHGNLISAGVVINPNAKITNYCVLQAGCVVDCDAIIEECANLGPGVIVGAKAHIGEGAVIGAGAVIFAGVKIGENAQVAPGAVVIRNVEKGGIVFGNPAQAK